MIDKTNLFQEEFIFLFAAPYFYPTAQLLKIFMIKSKKQILFNLYGLGVEVEIKAVMLH